MCIFRCVDSGKVEIVLKTSHIMLWLHLCCCSCEELNRSVKRMARRNVLITGCSSGIGLAIAVKMAKDEQKRFKGNNLSVLYLYKNILFEMVLFFSLWFNRWLYSVWWLVSGSFLLLLSRKCTENILISVSTWYFCAFIEMEQLLELNSVHPHAMQKDSSKKQIFENIFNVMLLWVYIPRRG